MSNFKAGDFVVCVNNTRYPNQIREGIQKLVHSISLDGKYLRVQRDDRPEIGGYEAEDFVLSTYFADDDPLPPAPESVRYATLQYSWQGQYNDQALTVGPDTFTGSIALHIQGNSNSKRNKDMSLSVILDADDVLHLAHDLRRMAMEIKRKEKQNGS
ncbi:MAG: hypothetical protein [Caudoviricetes sp.]|nr:MAG: hypothetical protein [Caudoviricetes sp.]